MKSTPSSLLLRICATILLLCSVSGRCAASEPYTKGEKSFGPKIGFVSRNTSALGGLVFQYSFSRHVRIAPQASIIFRHKNLDALTVDVDVHFPMQLAASGNCAFYPLAGIDFMSWNRHDFDSAIDKDVSTHINRFGLDAGIGFEGRCTPTLKLFVEAKYKLVKTYPGAEVAAGISFVF